MLPEALLNDEYVGFPFKRLLEYLLRKRKEGFPIIGYYCYYAPLELIWALKAIPTVLCTSSNKPISAAEAMLPPSVCPLIKSNYGSIITDSCPLYGLSEAVIAETTCDGKKKMYELIGERKPMFILELTQKPDDEEAFDHWLLQVKKMAAFLEETFKRPISAEALEEAIKEANKRRKLIVKIFEFARHNPPYIQLAEINEFLPMVSSACGDEALAFLETMIEKLTLRMEKGTPAADRKAPRVMLTGCPIAGDSEKIIRVLEQAGAAVVMQESCSGIKPQLQLVNEDTGDPLTAIARRYFELPCSVMTPNRRRLAVIDRLIGEYRPDAVVDVILSGCHTYNIESHLVREHIVKAHSLPFLKVETDYAPEGMEQLRTRVEALLEMVQKAPV
ncbi:MAG: double-cubane-cluster-containing anaerobic reductase [Candidatus Eremiobacteraeota bacterium]|nr:double-cubane-cluster-containing anaerobic reductase [Candidatus Eremiobacteraeota bacterium]